MAWNTGSHPSVSILDDCQIEDKKLLGYEDQSENDSESAWTRDDIIKQSRKVIPRPSTIRGWGFLAVLLIATSALSGTLGYLFKQGCTEKECILMTSSPSPLLDLVELYDYQFDAELEVENLYKGAPNPELDAAWDRLGKLHPWSMPTAYLAPLNKSDSFLLYPEELGGGVMVETEVFHQLHCLNFLRRVIYADYYSRPENLPNEFHASDELFFNHIDHCIDNFRQFVMCQSDVTPVTSNWVMGHRSPSPDFNTVHKCRNFDKLLEWVEEHDNGGVPRQTPNEGWRPQQKLAKTILDFEPDFPIPPHAPYPPGGWQEKAAAEKAAKKKEAEEKAISELCGTV